MVVVLNNSKALRGFFCTYRSDGLNITSVGRTAPDSFAANGAAVSQNQQQITRKATAIAPDKF